MELFVVEGGVPHKLDRANAYPRALDDPEEKDPRFLKLRFVDGDGGEVVSAPVIERLDGPLGVLDLKVISAHPSRQPGRGQEVLIGDDLVAHHLHFRNDRRFDNLIDHDHRSVILKLCLGGHVGELAEPSQQGDVIADRLRAVGTAHRRPQLVSNQLLADALKPLDPNRRDRPIHQIGVLCLARLPQNRHDDEEHPGEVRATSHWVGGRCGHRSSGGYRGQISPTRHPVVGFDGNRRVG